MKTNLISLIFILMVSVPMITSAQNTPAKKMKLVKESSIELKNGKEVSTVKNLKRYDEAGNLVEEIDYDDLGKITSHTTAEYDGKNQKTKETDLLPDGKMNSVTYYTYDSYGNRTSKTVTDNTGAIKSKKVFYYEYY